ncbi:hypothetical protein EDD18DRAFT_1357362 [Armillaria luteobubalina]|uniref:Uncharacterized protein n=1 Tax=Armillaria luteobubalina TaxID=153913 RepID=A0AA39Q0E9_9AGAR|nr:hypothetical protein EDD18DRAFT_1357362 [Armillaria luteobubalina]
MPKPASSSSHIKLSTKAAPAKKPLSKATKPPSKAQTKHAAPQKSARSPPSAQPKLETKKPKDYRKVLLPKDTNKAAVVFTKRLPMPQRSDNVEQENEEIEESDLVSGGEDEDEDEDEFELGFGDEGEIAEGKIGKSEDEGEGEGERMSGDDDNEKDDEIGQKRRKKSQSGPRKTKYRRGYSQRQNWVLSVCHSLGKPVPRVISLFTPVDDIMWAGAKLLNKALKLDIDVKDVPYTDAKRKIV